MKTTTAFGLFAVGCANFVPLSASAVEEQASDGLSYSNFGNAVSQSGSTGLVGSVYAGGSSVTGAVYVFQGLDTATGVVTENAKLVPSDSSSNNFFGGALSQSGNTGLIGASSASLSGAGRPGAAYVFRGVNTATGTVTQNVKLTASDGTAKDYFGTTVSLAGSIGLVGANGAKVGGNANQGAAYVFRGLDTATGAVTENVKLTASDGAASSGLGNAVSLAGSIGLVGASYATVGGNANQGAAYVFRGLDTATGAVTENAKLAPTDGRASDNFGRAVSLAGSTALVGSNRAAYLFRNLNTAVGTVAESVKLTATDGASTGYAVSLSGNTALVGSSQAAYLFRNLDTAAGTVTENVKLTASDGTASDGFSMAVSLDGDRFNIGAYRATGVRDYSGKAYSGTVSSVTTLDTGNTTAVISGLSFVSQDNWIVGSTTSGNQVSLSKGGTASVLAAGEGVYVGQNAGSNNNTLLVQGTVTANTIIVGNAAGSTGNQLQIANDGTTSAGKVTAAGGITLNSGGTLLLSGSRTVTDRLGDTAALTINGGGELITGGLSEGTAPTAAGGNGGAAGTGALTLSNTGAAAAATIDFGNAQNGSALVFGSLTAGGKGAFVSILGFTGGAEGDSGAATNDRLLFMTDPNYTAADLANWTFRNDAGTLYGVGAIEIAFNGYFEIVPVPEPATWLAGSLLIGATGLIMRRRHRCAVTAGKRLGP